MRTTNENVDLAAIFRFNKLEVCFFFTFNSFNKTN
jgi:hypothetical protein